MDVTPPPSPKVPDESLSEKRRSGRHTQRKKYVDDVDFNLSDDENLLMPPSEEVKAAKSAQATTAEGTPVGPDEADSGTATPKEVNPEAGKAPPPSEDVSAEQTQSGPNYAYVVITINWS